MGEEELIEDMIKQGVKDERAKGETLGGPTPEKLNPVLTEVVNSLQGQRGVVPDTFIRLTLSAGLKVRRGKYKNEEDKEEFDRIVKAHEALATFCEIIKLEL